MYLCCRKIFFYTICFNLFCDIKFNVSLIYCEIKLIKLKNLTYILNVIHH